MAQEFSRTRRVGEQIQRELAALIQFEMKDPRLGMVTVSSVDVSRDLSVAKVYFTVLGKSEADSQQSLEALNHAAGFLRKELGRGLQLRSVPRLQFYYDSSIERGAHLSALIQAAVNRDNNEDE